MILFCSIKRPSACNADWKRFNWFRFTSSVFGSLPETPKALAFDHLCVGHEPLGSGSLQFVFGSLSAHFRMLISSTLHLIHVFKWINLFKLRHNTSKSENTSGEDEIRWNLIYVKCKTSTDCSTTYRDSKNITSCTTKCLMWGADGKFNILEK